MSLLIVIIGQASFYALIAVGYVLIYRSTRVLNLAQGDLMVLGGYGFLAILTETEGAWAVALPAGVLLASLVGALIYLVVMRPLAGYPPAAGILATIAIALVVRAAVTLVWSGRTRFPRESIPEATTTYRFLGDLTISAPNVFAIAIATILLSTLGVVLWITPIGMRMRAVAESTLLAAQRGMGVHTINALVWGLAAGFAALGGAIYGVRVRLSPDIWQIGLAGFAPALVGGLDSLRGIVPGALIVAAAEVMTVRLLAPQLSPAAPYVVALIVLWVRPWGLFGTREELERV